MSTDINPLSLVEVSLDEVDDELACQSINDAEEDPLAIDDTSDNFFEKIIDETVKNGLDNYQPSPEAMVEVQIKKLHEVSTEEWSFRLQRYSNSYSDLSIVCTQRLHCTVCSDHIGCSIDLEQQHLIHPLLKVLICPKCQFKYNHITFPLNTSGMDVRCRWCGQTVDQAPLVSDRLNSLKKCSVCPFAFCERCIHLNISSDFSLINCQLSSDNLNNWVCFVCRSAELWPHRALAWALANLLFYLKNSCTNDSSLSMDLSTCCKRRKLNGHAVIIQKKLVKKASPKPTVRSKHRPIILQKKLRTLVPKITSDLNNLPVGPGQQYTVYKLTQNPKPASSFKPPVLSVISPVRSNARWFKNTVGYNILENITVLRHQIKVIYDSVSNDESDTSLSSKVDAVHKCLMITSRQLENNRKALISDWNARQSVADSCNTIASFLNPPEHISAIEAQNKNHVLEANTSMVDSVGFPGKKINENNCKSPPRQHSKSVEIMSGPLPKMTDQSYKIYKLEKCNVRLTKSSIVHGDFVVYS